MAFADPKKKKSFFCARKKEQMQKDCILAIKHFIDYLLNGFVKTVRFPTTGPYIVKMCFSSGLFVPCMMHANVLVYHAKTVIF